MAVAAQASVEVLFYVAVPVAVTRAANRFTVVRRIGPVLFCYGAGLLVGNQPWWQPNTGVALLVAQGAVALAIPLLLFPLDLLAWLRLARNTVVSFAVCVGAVLAMSVAAAVVFGDAIPDAPEVAGMMVGVYTGGTPNMAAIGAALRVEPERFVLLNTADVLVGAVYLAFLLTVAGRLLAGFLPPTTRTGSAATSATTPAASPGGLRARAPALVLALAVVACAWGAGTLAPEAGREVVILLTITTLALALSRLPRVRALPGSASMGDGALLVFCVAIGATADFGRLAASTGPLFAMVAFVVFGSLALHLGAARLLLLDRDTVIITSTAAIFGPAFVPPVAAALGNREVILSGLMTGLVGYAVGNYLGVGLAWLLGGSA